MITEQEIIKWALEVCNQENVRLQDFIRDYKIEYQGC